MRRLILAVVVVVLCCFGAMAQQAELPKQIDRAALTERIAALKAQQMQLVANLNATDGAIQDCEYWLSVLDKADKAEAK